MVALAALGLSIPTAKTYPLSTVDYALFFATQVLFAAHTYYNHYTSRRSSDLILLFWPIYVMVAAVRVRTMIITGALSLGMQESSDGRMILAREICWLSSIGIGLIGFSLELFSPEKRWKKLKWMRGGGKIRLDDSDEDESDDEGTTLKNEDGDMESPVVTANLYERLTFSWLTRKYPSPPVTKLTNKHCCLWEPANTSQKKTCGCSLPMTLLRLSRTD